jgi:hypothetical protein
MSYLHEQSKQIKSLKRKLTIQEKKNLKLNARLQLKQAQFDKLFELLKMAIRNEIIG